MKIVYSRPEIEIEAYSLSESIAANCGYVVTSGPGDVYGNNICEEFGGSWDIMSVGLSVMSGSFYNGLEGPACDCYTTAGGEGYFTS